MLKRKYELDITHARMVEEMAKFHARDRGTGMDSPLTLSRIIEIVYREWKWNQRVLHEEPAPAKSHQAVVLYEER